MAAALPGLMATAGAVCAQDEQADPARTDALLAAIAAEGCVVTEDNNAAILDAAGLGVDEARRIVLTLLADGRAEPAAGGEDLRLTTGGCP